MKKLLVVVLTFSCALAFAESVTVLERTLPKSVYVTRASSTFYMDTLTGQGHVKVLVTEYRHVHHPFIGAGDYRNDAHIIPPIPRKFYTATVEVPNLVLDGDQIVYRAADRDVDCGKLVKRRLRTTLYLSGNCRLKSKLNGNDLLVTLNLR